MEYHLGGVTYRPNLKPVKQLWMSFKKSNPASAISGSGYFVGLHDGKTFITTAAPVG